MVHFTELFISVLFFAKLLLTAAIPIAHRIEIQKLPVEDREQAGRRSVSPALPIDIFLLLALVAISAVTGQGIFHLSAFWLFVVGVGAIVLSMICCVIVGRILEWVRPSARR
jgi:hypothetical protein